MTPFDQAWSLLKSDVDIYREVSPDIFQDMSYMTEPLSDEELKVVTDFFGNIEDRAVRAKDSGQIYPQGNLPQYHPAIYGLMARQKIQDSCLSTWRWNWSLQYDCSLCNLGSNKSCKSFE